jgi:DNA-directed RNA polymerase subunit RPC12/RpoP
VEKNDEVIVLCGPISSAVFQGSKIYQCTECGSDCACSKVGRKLLDEGAKPYCPGCGLKRIAKQISEGKPPGIMDPTEALNLAEEYLKSPPTN